MSAHAADVIQVYAEAIEQGVIAEPKEAAAVIRAESVR
jgi:hypothetical protein